MSGHSKWASIKHKKAAIDAKKGKAFSRISKELSVAAKAGGKDPDKNPRLRLAISKAKEANMPSDNIDRAVKKGTGELPGVTYEEIKYEGYAPGGVAVMVEALTDNKNRTTAEIRSIFSKLHGNMAGQGSVSWMFAKKGFILIDKSKVEEGKLIDLVLELGAEDMNAEGSNYEVTTDVGAFEAVKDGLKKNGIEPDSAELTMVPSSEIRLDEAKARQVLGLVEALEDHEDVQNVYVNFDIPDEIMQKIEK